MHGMQEVEGSNPLGSIKTLSSEVFVWEWVTGGFLSIESFCGLGFSSLLGTSVNSVSKWFSGSALSSSLSVASLVLVGKGMMTVDRRYELVGWDYEAVNPLSDEEVWWYQMWARKTGGPVFGV